MPHLVTVPLDLQSTSRLTFSSQHLLNQSSRFDTIAPKLPIMVAPTEPGGAASINSDGKSFFDVLPRELRDRIYEYTFDHDTEDHFYRYYFSAPQPHLRLASRQFMHGYDEQTQTDATLHVVGRNERVTYIYDSPKERSLHPLRPGGTSAEMSQYVGEADFLVDDVASEHYLVRHSLLYRINDFSDFILRLELVREVKIQFNFNFVKSFESLYEHICCFVECFQYDREEVSANITIELRHLELSYPNLPICLNSEIQDLDILKRSATLMTFYYTHGISGERTTYDAVIERRRTVEAAVLAAWEEQYGCSLSKSAKKATGIEDDISSVESEGDDKAWGV